MMMPSQEAVPIELPPLGYPTPAEQQVLEAFTARLAGAVGGAFAGKGVKCACGAEVHVAEGWDREWAVEAAWRQEVPWGLRLSQGAAEAILAAELGQDELTEHAFTELDLRIVREALQGLARETGRELEEFVEQARGVPHAEMGRRQTAPAEVTTSLTPNLLQGEPLVLWPITLQYGSLAGEATLVTVWEELAGVLMPQMDETVLQVEALHGAPVVIEALLPGPAVTAGELWGMQPGDVLKLGALDRWSIVTANGQPFARGRAGARGNRLAVNIQEIELLQEG